MTVVVNVGDDDDIYGVRVCPDLDTVTYTLAGIEGPDGWGITGDTFLTMDHLTTLGVDTTFRLGDCDLATCLYRTMRLGEGLPLSTVTAELGSRHAVTARILPVTDDPVHTRLQTDEGEWLDFQEYFVRRRHTDVVRRVEYDGAEAAKSAPGVAEAIESSDLVLIAPSNPVVSIGPILAIPGIQRLVEDRPRVSAVSPLFGGATVKGPAADLLRSTGLGEGNRAVATAYRGLITHLVVDSADAADVELLSDFDIAVSALPTLLTDEATAGSAAAAILNAAERSAPRRTA